MLTPKLSLDAKSFARLLLKFSLILLVFAMISRIGITIMGVQDRGLTFWDIIQSFGLGILFDFCAFIYAFTVIVIAYLLIPRFILVRTNLWFWFLAAFLIGLFLFLYVGEYYFYDEFHDRYNFIAVDYLVYTTEVINNILQSYPIYKITSGIVAVSLATLFFCRKWLRPTLQVAVNPIEKLKVLGVFAFIFAFIYFVVDEQKILNGKSFAVREDSKNAVYTLFSAYLNNQIDYDRFYAKLGLKEALQYVQQDLGGANPENSIVHEVRGRGEFKPYNVVLVSMESMSAKFMTHYGSKENITPNLDRLAKEGLFFDRIFATGTRTVRGLEALTLSVPPTPGQSILRRPNNDKLFNIASPLRARGYTTQFIYGGYAVFDNMKAFYEANHFEVHDEATFPSSEIDFSNAWGVSDVDLFQQAVKQADLAYKNKKPFMQLIMTTSNHRPYTYPNQCIDIASGSSRFGAVKYSDYSIGKFVEDVKTKPWFSNTIFIFVADHNASVAGSVDVPAKDYLIPFIVYAPGIIPVKTISKLGSQIDVAPTVLALLNTTYQSRFFGKDLQEEGKQRTFLSNYQKVGYLEGDEFILLAPMQKIERYKFDAQTMDLKLVDVIDGGSHNAKFDSMIQTTISLYQSASFAFNNGLLKEEGPQAAR